jgi:hypothetical protein
MSKSNATENDVLKAILSGVDPSWRANPNNYLALYTSDPGEAGTAVTNETAYTNYQRQAIAKSGGWTDGGSSFSNASLVSFPACGAASPGAPLTHWGIVTTASGAGQLLYSDALTDALTMANLIQPLLAPGSLVITEN